ncbi:hypothetical protein MKW94_027211 [Papaver nudicaule]|uniref:Uncharacterized protein n=1 Tax=Papaver nudicaule TaxID=74823 RepID=A0AA41VIT5_PAPNU|nr:hypothetical protein [Papaver nudicaule]
MHSMPAISLHPNSNWLAAQSLDNQILIYSTEERFQLNKTKTFARFLSHPMDSMLCLEMVRASVCFGIGRLAKFDNL